MSEMAPDLEADYFALRDDVGVVELARDAVAVTGADARSFLQGQLSQDVDLATGSAAWSLLLSPQGKMVALVRVLRRGDDDFVLDFDRGWSAVVVERLERFKLRVAADVTPLDGWQCLAVRGPNTAQSAPEGALPAWPGLVGFDLLGESPPVPGGARRCSPEAYEVLRIEAGVPVMGAELDESTIPAEAGIVEPSVSFTKGCYTGQELVARIDSRGGNVPRRLRGVVAGTGEAVPAGARVMVDGQDVGRVTSAAYSPGAGATVALAYVGRKVEPPAGVELGWDERSASARLTVLPIPVPGEEVS